MTCPEKFPVRFIFQGLWVNFSSASIRPFYFAGIPGTCRGKSAWQIGSRNKLPSSAICRGRTPCGTSRRPAGILPDSAAASAIGGSHNEPRSRSKTAPACAERPAASRARTVRQKLNEECGALPRARTERSKKKSQRLPFPESNSTDFWFGS